MRQAGTKVTRNKAKKSSPDISPAPPLQRSLLQPRNLLVQCGHPAFSLVLRVRVDHQGLCVRDDLERMDSRGEIGNPGLRDEHHASPRPQVALLAEVRDNMVLQNEPTSLPLHPSLFCQVSVETRTPLHVCRAV